MLSDTPLGDMLEVVSGQLLDRVLTTFPNRRLSGPEIVKLAKGAAKSGWAVALHLGPQVADGGVTLVLRGAAGKELKPIASRLMGSWMGNAKYKTDRKDGDRTVVVVLPPAPPANAGPAPASWAWWPENDDLVVGGPYPAEADRIIAALDGKAPSAAEHPIVQELMKPEGSFEPVFVTFVDVAGSPDIPVGFTSFLKSVHETQGVNRIDLRWGFDGDALMTVTRLVAPKPWKSLLTVVDQPTFEKTSLMPMPDSVESFVELSMSPSKLIESLEQFGEAGAGIRAQIDALSESIKTMGSIDLKKDILGHLGPRMVAYLAPGRTATTNDDSLEAALKNGLTPTAAVTIMQSFFPKLTLVAEVDDPVAFGKGLDTAITVINHELQAQAIEKEAEDRAATATTSPGGGGRMEPGRPGGGGDGSKRKRSKVPAAPRFQTTIGQANSESTASPVKSFVLMTPTDSPLRFGPSSFRPTILMEDKYVAFAVSSDVARAAVAAAKRKDWKASSELERACEKVPSSLVALSVNDVRETLSSLLASLPGTLQTTINTSIALTRGRSGTVAANAGGGPPGAPAGMGMPPQEMSRRGGGGRPGAMRAPGAAGSRPGFGAPAAPTTSPTATSGSASDSMIVLRVDADKLPKAADLKAQIFPSTFSVSTAGDEVRFVTRGAFPDLSLPIGMIPAAAMMPAVQAMLEQMQSQAGKAADGAAESTGTAPAGASAPGTSKDAGPPAGPGRRGGRRG
jgi:hypothetical protein